MPLHLPQNAPGLKTRPGWLFDGVCGVVSVGGTCCKESLYREPPGSERVPVGCGKGDCTFRSGDQQSIVWGDFEGINEFLANFSGLRWGR